LLSTLLPILFEVAVIVASAHFLGVGHAVASAWSWISELS